MGKEEETGVRKRESVVTSVAASSTPSTGSSPSSPVGPSPPPATASCRTPPPAVIPTPERLSTPVNGENMVGGLFEDAATWSPIYHLDPDFDQISIDKILKNQTDIIENQKQIIENQNNLKESIGNINELLIRRVRILENKYPQPRVMKNPITNYTLVHDPQTENKLADTHTALSHDTEITDTEIPVPNDPGPSTQTDNSCTNTDSMVDDIDGPEDTPSTSQQSRTKNPCMLPTHVYEKLKLESINAQNFAVKLMGVVFTKEELASSTVGGGRRKLPSGETIHTKALSPFKMQGIKRAAENEFPDTYHRIDSDALNNKCRKARQYLKKFQ